MVWCRIRRRGEDEEESPVKSGEEDVSVETYPYTHKYICVVQTASGEALNI